MVTKFGVVRRFVRIRTYLDILALVQGYVVIFKDKRW